VLTFELKISNTEFKEKFILYSAHELNLIGLLTSFGLSSYKCINETYYGDA